MANLYLVDNHSNYRCSELDFGFNNTYDVMNFEHTRNEKNMDYDDYNCFGYALGTYNWGCPYLTYDYLYELKDNGIISNNDITEYELILANEIIEIAKIKFHINMSYEDASIINDNILSGVYSDTLALEIAKRNMLAAFRDLRIIQSFDELKENEYGIVYAVGDSDYHYARYYPEHYCYIHKIGRLDPEIVTDENSIFGERYYSDRLYFAKKRSNNDYFDLI